MTAPPKNSPKPNSSLTMSLNLESSSTQPHLHPKNQNIHEDHDQEYEDDKAKTSRRYMALLVINYLCLFLGSVCSSLISKYYFIHRGSSRWVSTWVQSAGFPLLLPPICLLRRRTRHRLFAGFTPRTLVLSVSIGLFLGLNNLLFSWGTSYLPVSTSSLLLSSQLLFNLLLSSLIVKQKITFSNLNCVVLLTLSSVLLALASAHDRRHVSRSDYFVGFFSTIGAGLLFALYLPVMERVYSEVRSYEMVMEMQLIMEAAATALATAGMAAGGGFAEMVREGREEFDKGERMYWMTLAGTVVTWQMCFMGTAGMVFLTSSLTSAVCMTALLAMNVIGGVVVYGDEFGGVKAVSTVMCCWGFCSYVYGVYVKLQEEKDQSKKREKKKKMNQEMDMMDLNGNSDDLGV